MSTASRLNVEDLPDSAYTRELRAGVARLRFDAALERQFLSDHLQRVHRRARIWFSLGVVLSILFAVAQVRRAGFVGFAFWAQVCGTVPGLLALAWLSWSRYYERLFLRITSVLAPILGALIAALVAVGAAAHGQQYGIAALTANVIGSFFFMGLTFRAGVVTALAMLVAFTASSMGLGLMDAQALTLVALGLTALLSAIVMRDVEGSYRRSFLEGALLAQWVTRDGLSGLMNRRTMDAELLRVWEQAQRDRRTVAIMMIDIDHFKGYNDTYGHQSGDEAIRTVARLLSDAARRPLDLAARYGGEEFMVLLYDVPALYAQEVAERLRQAVQDEAPAGSAAATGSAATMGSAALWKRNGGRVTVSIGVAAVRPAAGCTPVGALQLADQALYEAKQAGRNRVITRGSESRALSMELVTKISAG